MQKEYGMQVVQKQPWIRSGSGSVAAEVAGPPGLCRRVDSCDVRRGLLIRYFYTLLSKGRYSWKDSMHKCICY